MAGTSVLRLEEDFWGAAVFVAEVVAAEVVGRVVVAEDSASAEVRDAYSAEFVIVLVLSVVIVEMIP